MNQLLAFLILCSSNFLGYGQQQEDFIDTERFPDDFDYIANLDSLKLWDQWEGWRNIDDALTVGCRYQTEMTVQPTFTLTIFDKQKWYPSFFSKRGAPIVHFIGVEIQDSTHHILLTQALDEYCTYGQTNHRFMAGNYLIFSYSLGCTSGIKQLRAMGKLSDIQTSIELAIR
ncbi:MAG: hypothetical protein AAF587_14325 [Bacteroidota bacterium]